MKSAFIAAIAFCTCVAGCAFHPSVKNKLEVRPIKHVPCWENMGPNTACGGVTVPPEQAEGFVVTVGWKRFNEITNQSGLTSYVDDDIAAKFVSFAVKEVVTRGYCKEAMAPDPTNVLGWDRGIYIVCSE